MQLSSCLQNYALVFYLFDQPKSGGLIGTILNPFEHLNPIKFTQKVLSSLMPSVNANAASNNSKTSPNNSIKAQTNIARNGEARPDNYGQIRAYPDQIQESLYEYRNNLKYITEFMNFGLGKYKIESVRYSETSLSTMSGASYHVYQPGEIIPVMYEGFEFDDVDGQEIPGPNEESDEPIESATANTVVNITFDGGQMSVQIVKQDEFDYFYNLAYPHSVTFIINVTYSTASGSITEDITVSADLFNATITDNGGTPVIEYYTFYFRNLSSNDIDFFTTSITINTTKFILTDNQALVIGPFFSPVVSDQLWVQLQAALGNKDYANTNIRFWKIDENNVEIPGTEQSINAGFPPKKGTDTYYQTVKITPSAGRGRYAIQFYRLENSHDQSKLKLEEIQAVRVRSNVSYPNDTLVKVEVRATEQATGARERKYNALITRHTISYNLSTQTVDYALRPSRKFADAVLHTWIAIGGQPVSSIDAYGLYQIQEKLDTKDQRLGYFDYTFDDEDVSLGNRIETICDAAGVTAFWDDGVMSFTLDERQTNPVTVFNRSNMVGADYALSCDATLPGGFDGVEVKYRNPSTNKQSFIRYKIQGNSIIEGIPNKAAKFELLYVRNAYQARNRALKEVRRLIYSRLSMSIKTLADGEWVNVGQMVQVADTYDSNQQAGYINARTGNDFDTGERINFSGSMFVVVTDSIGNPTARIPAYPRSDTAFGFTAAVPNIPLNIWDGINKQSSSRYIIATNEELDSTLWVITEKKPNSDGTTSLTLSEYSDEIYNYEVTE
ncbi:MoaD/ThiS family protein [Budviciaceae bacterium BWR-B9]|uniref:MoaD/ThiS family protein n=1 Tax=Limnobaculum allomyrinae TaxID=2791986 RepID=A0ABS1IUI1_9GAMM|nr:MULTISPECIES: host specificity factor TipJ family phage tail protein [Limnobaculum]MBK5145417.1 MoaD/ThiS family protein [Limnobaculum allomyrinae]MBV7693155.1 MoaD/ThiS family protein [Limnobaculum sp. M2-1]